MTAGDSALYRATAGLARPLFTVSTGTHSWGDAGIHAITITHGKPNPAGGLDPATAEIEVGGAVGVIHDRHITVKLNDAAAVALGGSTAAAVRFAGRVATQRVSQRPRRGQGPDVSSTLLCSSWSSLYLAAAGNIPGVTASYFISEVVQAMFDRTQRRVGRAVPLTFSGAWDDLTYKTLADKSFAEGISQYVAEPGWLLRQRRDGTIQGMSSLYRAEAGESAAANWYSITPGHVAHEVQHEQKTDVSDVGIRLSWTESVDGVGTTITRDWAWPGSRDGVPSSSVLEWREYDWTHILWRTEQYRWGINALSSQAFRVAYTTPRITIDLLALATSSRHYDAVMLRQLLTLEQGDPVTLGGDWSSWWNGLYYAEQIQERITPDEWTLELSLFPPQEVTGWYGNGGAPAIPARLWSQATKPWPTGTTNWS